MAKKPAKRKAKRKVEYDRSPKAEYERFLETAREVGASDDPKDLDKAFKHVIRENPSPKNDRGC